MQSAKYYSRTLMISGSVWIYSLHKHTSDKILEQWAFKALHTHLGLTFIKLY